MCVKDIVTHGIPFWRGFQRFVRMTAECCLLVVKDPWRNRPYHFALYRVLFAFVKRKLHSHLRESHSLRLILTENSAYDEQASPSQNRVAQPPPAVFEFRLTNRHQSTGKCARATLSQKEI
jgi:hypothetical protein